MPLGCGSWRPPLVYLNKNHDTLLKSAWYNVTEKLQTMQPSFKQVQIIIFRKKNMREVKPKKNNEKNQISFI